MTNFNYQVGGSLPADAPSYVERQCDRDYYELLKERKYCYVFNCRQMGKSSLRVRVTHKLQAEGIVCATIDPQKIGVEVTCEQWYASAIRSLVGDLDLKNKFDLRSWIRERELLSPVQRFAEFIESVVLREIDAPIVIFVEEIDRLLSLKFGMDDFFGLVRSFFEDRPTKPDYNRLTFSFLGVATPTDLIQSHNTSAFNIGYAVEMAGFTLTEALPLMQGLASKVANPQDYLAEAVKWTGGQPFLIQRLLGMMEKELAGIAPPENIADWVENLVQERIVTNWEAQDAPPHLTTIRDRVISVEEKLRGRMLGCYQQVLEDGELEDDRSEERSKLRLTGLVVRRDGRLVSYNPIYGLVFNNAWVEGQLADLRPEFYASAFRAWRDAEEGQNQGFLLRDQALEEAEVWARGKRLSDIDEQFLRESQNLEKREIEINLESERRARLIAEESNLILNNANLIAKQRVKIGSIFLLLTLTLSGVASIWSGRNVADAVLDIKLAKIKLLSTESKADFLENREIEALIKAVSVGKQLKKLDKANWSKNDLQNELTNTLSQVVYGIKERNHWNSIETVSVSSNGKNFASVENDSNIKIRTLDGKLNTSFTAGSKIKKLSWSPDGKIIASIDSSSTKLWSINGNLLHTFPSSKFGYLIAWSPDSKLLILLDHKSSLIFNLWSIDGKLLNTFHGHNNIVLSLSWSPDGAIIASGSKDSTVKLWNIDGELLKTLPSPRPDNNGRFGSTTGNIWCLDWSHDSVVLAAGGNDRTIQLWNRDGELIANLRGHSDTISSLNWERRLPNDSDTPLILSSSSQDGTVKLWTYFREEGGAWNYLKSFVINRDNGVSQVFLIPQSNSLIALDSKGKLRLLDFKRLLLDRTERESGSRNDTLNRITNYYFRDEQIVRNIQQFVKNLTGKSVNKNKMTTYWNLDLDDMMTNGCAWLHDYLVNNPNASDEDRQMCGIAPRQK